MPKCKTISSDGEDPWQQQPHRKKPKRGMTAYNFFFREERNRILDEIEAKERLAASTPLSSSVDGSDISDSSAIDTPYETESSSSGGFDRGGGSCDDSPRKSKKRKSKSKQNGKMTFQGLGQEIAKRWKSVSPESLARYKAMAETDSKRYKDEMEIFHEEQVAAMCMGGNKWGMQGAQDMNHVALAAALMMNPGSFAVAAGPAPAATAVQKITFTTTAQDPGSVVSANLRSTTSQGHTHSNKTAEASAPAAQISLASATACASSGETRGFFPSIGPSIQHINQTSTTSSTLPAPTVVMANHPYRQQLQQQQLQQQQLQQQQLQQQQKQSACDDSASSLLVPTSIFPITKHAAASGNIHQTSTSTKMEQTTTLATKTVAFPTQSIPVAPEVQAYMQLLLQQQQPPPVKPSDNVTTSSNIVAQSTTMAQGMWPVQPFDVSANTCTAKPTGQQRQQQQQFFAPLIAPLIAPLMPTSNSKQASSDSLLQQVHVSPSLQPAQQPAYPQVDISSQEQLCAAPTATSSEQALAPAPFAQFAPTPGGQSLQQPNQNSIVPQIDANQCLQEMLDILKRQTQVVNAAHASNEQAPQAFPGHVAAPATATEAASLQLEHFLGSSSRPL